MPKSRLTTSRETPSSRSRLRKSRFSLASFLFLRCEQPFWPRKTVCRGSGADWRIRAIYRSARRPVVIIPQQSNRSIENGYQRTSNGTVIMVPLAHMARRSAVAVGPISHRQRQKQALVRCTMDSLEDDFLGIPVCASSARRLKPCVYTGKIKGPALARLLNAGIPQSS